MSGINFVSTTINRQREIIRIKHNIALLNKNIIARPRVIYIPVVHLEEPVVHLEEPVVHVEKPVVHVAPALKSRIVVQSSEQINHYVNLALVANNGRSIALKKII